MNRASKIAAGGAFAAATVGLVAGYEGYRPNAYRDPVNVVTICYGETKNVRMGQHATKAECDAMLMKSLIEHENGMNKCLTRDIPDKVREAFISFTFNIGIGAFCHSNVAMKANAGDLRGACNALLAWDRAKGKHLPGLTRRRHEERDICLEGAG